MSGGLSPLPTSPPPGEGEELHSVEPQPARSLLDQASFPRLAGEGSGKGAVSRATGLFWTRRCGAFRLRCMRADRVGGACLLRLRRSRFIEAPELVQQGLDDHGNWHREKRAENAENLRAKKKCE